MATEFIHNGVGSGSIATRLLRAGGDPNVLRPYRDNKDRPVIVVNKKGKPTKSLVHNDTATLRYDEWKEIDRAVITAAKPRLRVFGDLRASGLTYGGFNGMAKSVLLHQDQSDIGPAMVSMNPVKKSENDRPEYGTKGMPLPVISKDFSFNLRELLESRNGSTPLDLTMAALCGEKVAEEVERLCLGTSTNALAYAGYNLYGMTTFPQRGTQVLTNPTAGGWEPDTTRDEVIAMIKQSYDDYNYGPFRLYYSPNWMPAMQKRYNVYDATPLATVLGNLEGITSVAQADYLPGYQMILVQQSPQTIQAVVGMDVTTVQWETHGGMEFHYKVMAILLTRLRSDHYGRTGIVHGTAP